MFTHWRRERRIRRALRQIARQRVVTILQPGNVPVIERSPVRDEGMRAALLTCELRGWVQVLQDNVAVGQVTADGRLPNPLITSYERHYRLTEAGWNRINATHAWVIATFIVSFLALMAAILPFVSVLAAMILPVENVPPLPPAP